MLIEQERPFTTKSYTRLFTQIREPIEIPSKKEKQIHVAYLKRNRVY